MHQTFRAPLALETLEKRTLLAGINVADFGATPNDGLNDLGAIQAAINAAQPGQTIQLAAGIYEIHGKINITKPLTIEGIRGETVLRGFGPTGPQMHITADNVTVRGITFDGGGLFIDAPGRSWNDNITIDRNTFTTRTNGDHLHRASLTWTSGLRDSSITNNHFSSYNFTFWGQNGNNLRIANNVIDGAGYGMKVTGYHGNNHNVLVEQNYVTNVRAMGFEFQGEFDNLIVQDNYYDKPDLSAHFPDNDTTFAFSIIADRSRNTIMRRNTVIAPERPDGVGVRIGFEAGGENVQVVDNYVNGINHVAILNTSRNGRIVDNSFHNYLQGANAYGGRSPGAYIANNHLSPDQLTWDVNRGKPGIEHSVPIDKNQPSPAPTDQPQTEQTAPQNRSRRANGTWLSDLPWVSATNGWGPVELDMSNGEKRAGDGTKISLRGKEYDKGIGVAVASEIVYDLKGRYSTFFSDIGVDDYAGRRGSVTFEVWVDGRKEYDSGLLTRFDDAQSIRIDVSGARELKLVVTNGGNGDRDDHASWAGARLV